MAPENKQDKSLEQAGSQELGRGSAGCLIAVLAPAALVTLLFLGLGLFSLALALFNLGPQDPALGSGRGSSLFAGMAITLFSLPLTIVLGRALYGALVFAITGKRIPLVTSIMVA